MSTQEVQHNKKRIIPQFKQSNKWIPYDYCKTNVYILHPVIGVNGEFLSCPCEFIYFQSVTDSLYFREKTTYNMPI